MFKPLHGGTQTPHCPDNDNDDFHYQDQKGK